MISVMKQLETHNKNAFCIGFDQYTWNEVRQDNSHPSFIVFVEAVKARIRRFFIEF